jgi:hypothetical protein
MDSHEHVRQGLGLSGLLLRDGDFVACVYRGLADEFASARSTTIAAKVIKSARKKFSKLTFKVLDREISAWDYFCYAQHTGAVSGADKFISDFIRLALTKRLEDMPAAELHLLALSDIPLDAIDPTTEVSPDTVFCRVRQEVLRLAGEHGSTLVIEGLPARAGLPLAPSSLAPQPLAVNAL